MNTSEDLTLLHKWFDQTLPVVNYQKINNKVTFDLFDHIVVISIITSTTHQEAQWILQWLPDNPKGYIIDVLINDVTDVSDISLEFLIFTEILTQVNKLVTELNWNYLVFKGLQNHRNKIPDAIAQRLTKLQPNIGRIANRHPLTLIARF